MTSDIGVLQNHYGIGRINDAEGICHTLRDQYHILSTTLLDYLGQGCSRAGEHISG